MVGRMYSVAFEGATLAAAAQDLWEIRPADDKICIVHGCVLSNVGGQADAGDAQEELLRVLMRRGHATSGSGGATPTPAPLNVDTAAAGFSAETNNTTIASTGTTADLHADGWNVRIPYAWIPTPEMRPIIKQGDVTFVVRIVAAAADALTVNGTLYVEEI